MCSEKSELNMPKFAQGKFIPKNPAKYVGKRNPMFRSSWELVFCNFCDNHPSVISWASEAIAIPYMCPFRKRVTQYVPDFFITYLDRDGNQHVEIVEIKPYKETGQKKTRSQRDALVSLRNLAKWAAAQAYCEKQGFKFRVLTENELFRMGQPQ